MRSANTNNQIMNGHHIVRLQFNDLSQDCEVEDREVALLLGLAQGLLVLLVLGECLSLGAGQLGSQSQRKPLLAGVVRAQLRLGGLVDDGQDASDRLADDAAACTKRGDISLRRSHTNEIECANQTNKYKGDQKNKSGIVHLGELRCIAASNLGDAELAELHLKLLKLLHQLGLRLRAKFVCLDLGYTRNTIRKCSKIQPNIA